ncbi:MAG: ABC transporter permease [Anaerolineales bacterium]|nr:MAG: ABC transporter permease [Anaerolineales bacterium]
MTTTTLNEQTTRNAPGRKSRLIEVLHYLKRNTNLAIGLSMLAILLLFTLIGSFVIDPDNAYPGSVRAARPPSLEFPFGTDGQGRDLLTVAVMGTWVTLQIGFIASGLGLSLGIFLGFVSAYYGGKVDLVIRWLVDVFMTIPGFLILIVLAAVLGGRVSTVGTGLIISIFLWAGSARVVRAQVLSLRERQFVLMAKLSGLTNMEIIIEELMPNLLPFLGAQLIGSVMSAVYQSSGLAILGLGNLREPQLGTTLYWMQSQGALVRGIWWWIAVPVFFLCWAFVMLYLISSGMDELANPRLRRRV